MLFAMTFPLDLKIIVFLNLWRQFQETFTFFPQPTIAKHIASGDIYKINNHITAGVY